MISTGAHHQEMQGQDKQLASMEEISASSDWLARIANGLQDEINKFKI